MKFFFLVFILFVTGCTTAPKLTPVSNPDAVWQDHQHNLAALHQWRLRGRISIQNDDESWFLKVDWQQKPGHYAVLLSGPLSSMIRLSGNKDIVELSDGEQSFHAPDAELLLLEHTGIRMPVNGLRYWLLGLPQPDKKVKDLKLDVAGRMASVQQDEWLITVDRYQQYNGKTLPAKLVINNHHLKVRLIVDQWQLNKINS